MMAKLPADLALATPQRLLLVVPDAHMRQPLRRILGRCGYAIDCAVSGEEALSLAARNTYSAIISEVRLPGAVCGLTLLQRLRIAGQETPMILLTEEDGARLGAVVDQTPGVEWLRVPLDLDRLKQLVTYRCRH